MYFENYHSNLSLTFNRLQMNNLKQNSQKPQTSQTDVMLCAMVWWNKIEDNLNEGFSKWQLGYKYFDRHWMSLTDRDIEIIYKGEHINYNKN